ncbi:hypothetical protein KY092_08090 [Natronomonas gomsonensis]|uniref:hypothetical protein n=1 Tax=Natronomonas gomsonensis TaxID=1046043 RepID=UPI0020CA4CB4|nr:hypothetical protein [Natronomonas gomsonensis]MCY4730517.1 hypothetical protein [Natronomonas gomsonensis]
MSDIAVVDKEELRDYRDSIFLLGELVGIVIGMFMLAIFNLYTPAAVIGGVSFLGLVIALYLMRDRFSNIRQAIEDTEGENE